MEIVPPAWPAGRSGRMVLVGQVRLRGTQDENGRGGPLSAP